MDLINNWNNLQKKGSAGDNKYMMHLIYSLSGVYIVHNWKMEKVSVSACPTLTPKKKLRGCTLFWFRVVILVLLFRPKSHKFHNLIISAFKKQLKFDFYFQHQAGKPLILFCNK